MRKENEEKTATVSRPSSGRGSKTLQLQIANGVGQHARRPLSDEFRHSGSFSEAPSTKTKQRVTPRGDQQVHLLPNSGSDDSATRRRPSITSVLPVQSSSAGGIAPSSSLSSAAAGGAEGARVSGFDVRGWLAGFGMEQYHSLFESHNVDEQNLLEMTNEDLWSGIGIKSWGHRKKICKALEVYKAEKQGFGDMVMAGKLHVPTSVVVNKSSADDELRVHFDAQIETLGKLLTKEQEKRAALETVLVYFAASCSLIFLPVKLVNKLETDLEILRKEVKTAPTHSSRKRSGSRNAGGSSVHSQSGNASGNEDMQYPPYMAQMGFGAPFLAHAQLMQMSGYANGHHPTQHFPFYYPAQNMVPASQAASDSPESPQNENK